MRRRVLLAVSGTLQDGFELRGNLDHPEVPAVLVGDAVVRGVRAYLDIKDESSREYPGPAPARARVNPACVVTGDRSDANLYAVYLIDERVVLRSLLGEPRFLAMAPDCVRVDLQSPRTSPAVKALLYAAARRHGAREPMEASILTVLSCFAAPSFVPLPKTETVPDASGSLQVTSFLEGLAAFSGLPVERVREPGATDDALRAAEARLDVAALKDVRGTLATGSLSNGPSDAPWLPRLSEVWSEDTVASLATAAGFGDGASGAALAALTAGARGAKGCEPPTAPPTAPPFTPFTPPTQQPTEQPTVLPTERDTSIGAHATTPSFALFSFKVLSCLLGVATQGTMPLPTCIHFCLSS